MNDSRPPKHRRRRFQFSLRGLLLLVLACAVACLVVKVWRAKTQREAIAAVVAAGGSVHYRYQYTGGFKTGGFRAARPIPNAKPPGPAWVRGLLGEDVFLRVGAVVVSGATDTDLKKLRPHLMRLSSADYLTVECYFVSDAGIAHLDGLANLYGLRLRNSRITDSGMQHVGTLSGLVELDLEAEQVTDAGLAHLEGLIKLQKLHVDTPQATDAAVVYLKGLRDLQELSLMNFWPIRESGLVHLRALSNLETLYITAQCGAPGGNANASFKHFHGLTNLVTLDLTGFRITDERVKQLEGLTNLTTLGLNWCQVTDEALERLKGMTHLRALGLEEVALGDDDADALRAALPNCDIRGLRRQSRTKSPFLNRILEAITAE